MCVCLPTTLSESSRAGEGVGYCALRAGEQAVATGQEGAASFVLSETAESVSSEGVERPRRFLPVIEFIIDLLLNHGGVSVMRVNGGRCEAYVWRRGGDPLDFRIDPTITL